MKFSFVILRKQRLEFRTCQRKGSQQMHWTHLKALEGYDLETDVNKEQMYYYQNYRSVLTVT